MSDTEIVDLIIKYLCKSGWGDTKRHNLVYQVNRIIEEHKDQDDKLAAIRREVMR